MDAFGDPHWPLIPLPDEQGMSFYQPLMMVSAGGSGSGIPQDQGDPLVNPQPNPPRNPHPNPPAQVGGQAYLIPRFTGETGGVSVDDFVEAVTLARFLSSWDEEQTLAVARLRLGGAAAEHIRANHATALVDWSSLKAALRNRFGARVPRYALEQKFITCLQKKTETAAEFATRLQLLGAQLEKAMVSENNDEALSAGMMADRVLHQFLSGLKRDLRRFVLVRGPKNMADALTAAEAEEAAVEPSLWGAFTHDFDVRAVEAAMANMAMEKAQNIPAPPSVVPNYPPPTYQPQSYQPQSYQPQPYPSSSHQPQSYLQPRPQPTSQYPGRSQLRNTQRNQNGPRSNDCWNCGK